MKELPKISKAIAGAVAAILAAQFANWLGAQYTPEVDGALKLLTDLVVTGAIGYLFVFLAPKNKEI